MNAKFLIVLLVLIALAFIGFEVMGAGNHATAAPSAGSAPASADSFDPGEHPQMQSMNSILAPFSPKLKLPQTGYLLTAAQPVAVIAVPADSNDPLRQANFKLSSGYCAVLQYNAIGGTDDLKSQCGPDKSPGCPSSSGGNRNTQPDPLSASFVITKGGGAITLTRQSNGAVSCQVSLK